MDAHDYEAGRQQPSALETLLYGEQALRAVLEGLPDATVAAGRDGRIRPLVASRRQLNLIGESLCVELRGHAYASASYALFRIQSASAPHTEQVETLGASRRPADWVCPKAPQLLQVQLFCRRISLIFLFSCATRAIPYRLPGTI